MPCYGHSHCALCNIPVCPDCIGNSNDCDDSDGDDSSEKSNNPDIDMSNELYKWLSIGIALYEDKSVFDVTEYEEGILGLLCDANDKNKFHRKHPSKDSAIFLHKQCYSYLLEHNNLIPITNMWCFLAVYNIGAHSCSICDESNNFHCQNSLHQYYRQGDCKNDDKITYDDDINFMWLLQNPLLNDKNMVRINKRFNKMLVTYDWNDSFTIAGFRLK